MFNLYVNTTHNFGSSFWYPLPPTHTYPHTTPHPPHPNNTVLFPTALVGQPGTKTSSVVYSIFNFPFTSVITPKTGLVVIYWVTTFYHLFLFVSILYKPSTFSKSSICRNINYTNLLGLFCDKTTTNHTWEPSRYDSIITVITHVSDT